MKKLTLANVTILCSLLATPAQATVIVADGFDYTQQQLAGLNGGYSMDANNQWSSPWRDGTDFPLGAKLPSMEATGGSAMGTKANSGAIPGLIMGVERQVAESQATDTYYFGFDIKMFPNTSSPNVASLFGVGIDTPGGGGAPDLVAIAIVQDKQNNGGTQWFLHGNIKSGGVSGGGIYAAGVDHRVVGRLTFDKGGVNEELVLWVNPVLETDTPQITHHSQDMGSDINGMVLGIIARDVYAHPAWEGNTLNLTTTFAEAANGAIPEPATLGLLALGLVCLGARRRRR